NRRRNCVRRQRGGGNLVKQRLKQVVVVPIDQSDINRDPSEGASRRQSAEATADDDHAWSFGGWHRGTAWKRREGSRVIIPRMAPRTTWPTSDAIASLAPPKNNPTPRIGMATRPPKNQTPAMKVTPRSQTGPSK